MQPAHFGSDFCGPSSMFAAISNAMVTSTIEAAKILDPLGGVDCPIERSAEGPVEKLRAAVAHDEDW